MKTICIKFDVLESTLATSWSGEPKRYDTPLTGAAQWLEALVLDGRFSVSVYGRYSFDSDARLMMIGWFRKHFPEYLIEHLRFPKEQPEAWLTIDNRALCFSGTWPSPDELDQFVPWYQDEWADPRGDGERLGGELSMAVVEREGQVAMRFTQKVLWATWSPEQARTIAGLLMAKADEAEGK